MSQSAPSAEQRHFTGFADFYPYYLSEHRDRTCRRVHFLGTGSASVLLLAAAACRSWALLAAAPVTAYGLAWIGHFVFEKNRPATFSHPWYSLAGDFVMFRDMLLGRIRF